MAEQVRYLEPDRAARWFNAFVARLTRAGLSVWGSRVLSVRGRRSGAWRSVPVNVLTVDGERYLVAARGHTQWVRNLRAAGEGTLRVGSRVETFHATELDDGAKPALLRAYLRRWGWEVGAFFDGIDKNSPDDDLLAAAPGVPVFRLTSPAA
ncbi:nitroreductase family deazaflavin-dependent oxidoreductase [Saccharomonospora sp. CUA-673]|uniref:nitroreductase family deazaflavin-dependent oxidoreductase n=1 Tax=Saccharomonospora sp. CUA-673 TaxID=1904969 RepID=UPI00096A8A7B|nr:nitroreductase family deazaflavin-dependent oxidoreductase [Saccharomonospora sp. CUA-673]